MYISTISDKQNSNIMLPLSHVLLSPYAAKQEKKKKKVRFEGSVVNSEAAPVQRGREVNEQKVDLLLDMLKSADVTEARHEENKTVKELESE